MDSNKLLEILNLLEADEKDFSFGTKIEEISTLLSQNNEESSLQINDKTSQLDKEIKLSRAYQFTSTELSFLKELGLETLFGTELMVNIQTTLQSRGYEINSKFSQFKKKRADKYKTIMQLKSHMVEVGIVPYQQADDEVAFSIPSEISTIEEIPDYLKKFGDFIQSVQNSIEDGEEKRRPHKIVRLNRGSLEFFTSVDPQSIVIILGILSDLANIYIATKYLREKKSDSNLTEVELQDLTKLYEKAAKDRLESFIKKTVDKVLKKKIDNQQRLKLEKSLKVLVNWLPLGIRVDVVFKKSVESTDQTNVKAMELIDKKILQKLKVEEMYKLPLEQLKLPEPQDIEKLEPKAKKVKKDKSQS